MKSKLFAAVLAAMLLLALTACGKKLRAACFQNQEKMLWRLASPEHF